MPQLSTGSDPALPGAVAGDSGYRTRTCPFWVGHSGKGSALSPEASAEMARSGPEHPLPRQPHKAGERELGSFSAWASLSRGSAFAPSAWRGPSFRESDSVFHKVRRAESGRPGSSDPVRAAETRRGDARTQTFPAAALPRPESKIAHVFTLEERIKRTTLSGTAAAESHERDQTRRRLRSVPEPAARILIGPHALTTCRRVKGARLKGTHAAECHLHEMSGTGQSMTRKVEEGLAGLGLAQGP